jgi:threonine dehydratase
VPDRPGELVKLLTLIAQERVNVLAVEHHREGMRMSVAETEIELVLSTRDEAHREALVQTMEAWGYAVERLA